VNKVSNIKERIKKIGVTSANFRGKKLETGVNADLIEKIVSLYPDVNLHWLITGEQKKEDTAGPSIVNETEDRNVDVLERELAHAKELVRAKDETIASLQRALEIIGDRNGSSKAS